MRAAEQLNIFIFLHCYSVLFILKGFSGSCEHLDMSGVLVLVWEIVWRYCIVHMGFGYMILLNTTSNHTSVPTWLTNF
jgi:hypothetical protein